MAETDDVAQSLSSDAADARSDSTTETPSADRLPSSSMRMTAAAPPKRVIDLPQRGDLAGLPLPAAERDVVREEPMAEPDGPDGAQSASSAPTPAQSASSAPTPAPARSAPRSAVAHVAILESEPDVDQASGPERIEHRARTLIPQLFAAAVVGFIVVAGAAGVLLPPDQSAETGSRSDTAPEAPAEPVPAFTPAPTQTPELVIPSVPLDTESGPDGSVAPGSSGQDAAAQQPGVAAASELPVVAPRPRVTPSDPTSPATVEIPVSEQGDSVEGGEQPLPEPDPATDPVTDGSGDETAPVDPPSTGENDVGTVLDQVVGVVGEPLP